MEGIDDIHGDDNGVEQQAYSASERLAGSDNEEHSSAFRALKPFVKFSSSFPYPEVPSSPPSLPTFSPSWYSSLFSSLYRTGGRQHNNNLEQEREVKKGNKEAEGKFGIPVSVEDGINISKSDTRRVLAA